MHDKARMLPDFLIRKLDGTQTHLSYKCTYWDHPSLTYSSVMYVCIMPMHNRRPLPRKGDWGWSLGKCLKSPASPREELENLSLTHRRCERAGHRYALFYILLDTPSIQTTKYSASNIYPPQPSKLLNSACGHSNGYRQFCRRLRS